MQDIVIGECEWVTPLTSKLEAFHDVLVPASMTRCLSGSPAIFFLVGDMLCYIGEGWWLGPLL